MHGFSVDLPLVSDAVGEQFLEQRCQQILARQFDSVIRRVPLQLVERGAGINTLPRTWAPAVAADHDKVEFQYLVALCEGGGLDLAGVSTQRRWHFGKDKKRAKFPCPSLGCSTPCATVVAAYGNLVPTCSSVTNECPFGTRPEIRLPSSANEM